MSLRSGVSLPPEEPKAPVFIEQPEPASERAAKVVPPKAKWSPQELLSEAHLGPGIIGKEKYDACQAYVKSSANGVLGPATRGE